ALGRGGHSPAECGNQIGRTPEQVERWLAGADMVTPEMQDRITTWLGRPLVEIFGDARPPAEPNPRA
ncbi:MAG: hypothetical protein AAFY56_04925, partial [Pseudomonadota bacterium]